ncbi:MAG: FAD:protein FMN transferase [Firmicutes bacterium]|nr:FAD:protein FMN transferase [Bacillota bacterium]
MRYLRVGLLLVAIFFLVACSNGQSPTNNPDLKEYTETYIDIMDTLVDVRIVTTMESAEAESVLTAVKAEMQRLEAILSAHLPDSDVAKISASSEPVSVSPHTLNVVNTALQYADLTNGTFDITLAPVLDLYDFGEKRFPDEAQLADNLPLVDYTRVEVDTDRQTIALPKSMRLDLGGIAKGYIVDRAVDFLLANGVEYATVNAGGDIRVSGSKPDGTPWRIGIKNPNEIQHLFAVIEVSDSAIVTSGDYERYFEQDGIRFHHIIDPATGLPGNLCKSVTVVAPTAELADLLSTAIFVMGPEEGLALAESLDSVEALIWDADDEIHWTSGLEDRLELR